MALVVDRCLKAGGHSIAGATAAHYSQSFCFSICFCPDREVAAKNRVAFSQMTARIYFSPPVQAANFK
jgi:hypothetical protein